MVFALLAAITLMIQPVMDCAASFIDYVAYPSERSADQARTCMTPRLQEAFTPDLSTSPATRVDRIGQAETLGWIHTGVLCGRPERTNLVVCRVARPNRPDFRHRIGRFAGQVMPSRKGATYRVRPHPPKPCKHGHVGWIVAYQWYDARRQKTYRGFRCDECSRLRTGAASKLRRYRAAIRRIFVIELPY